MTGTTLQHDWSDRLRANSMRRVATTETPGAPGLLMPSAATAKRRWLRRACYRAEEIANELSSSIVINGDALDEEILKEANLEGSETVLALTNDDENNMMACVLAEKTGLKKRTIAIVNKTNYNLLQDSLNIDVSIYETIINISCSEKFIFFKEFFP